MEIIGKIIQVMPERSGTSARTGSEWRMGSYLLETTTYSDVTTEAEKADKNPSEKQKKAGNYSMGHTNINTTMKYICITDSKVYASYKQFTM